MRHRIIIAIAAAILAAPVAFAQTGHVLPPDPFKFLTSQEVTALTEKPSGPKAFYPAAHESYMVEFVTRTDSGNVAESHDHWMHYIRFIAGEGTLTYGTTATNPKQVSAGEIRGDAIADGTKVAVHPGDYVQIPAGTFHMINAAPGTKLQYMVFSMRE